MKSRTLSATALILLTPLVVLAFQVQAENVRNGALKSKPLITGLLKITIIEFYAVRSISYKDAIIIEVENTSDDFTTFAPGRLSFINKDNYQVDILGISGGTSVVEVGDKRIGPKARIKHYYVLTDNVQLPARLYYEDKLLATIID